MRRSFVLTCGAAIVVAGIACNTNASAPLPPPSNNPTPERIERATYDRPDDVVGMPQMHIVYAVPHDKCSSAATLDTDGTLARSVTAFENWLGAHANGRELRLDTYNGALDATFMCLKENDSDMHMHDPSIVLFLQSELRALGFADPQKIYAVYYDGVSSYACGGADWPPEFPGNVAAMYLHGNANGHLSCEEPFTSSANVMDYWEFAMLHDILHTMGIVGSCAPHYAAAYPGHTQDDPRDLMYSGPLPWHPSLLDPGNDDYFGHNIPGCPDLAKSPFLTQPQ